MDPYDRTALKAEAADAIAECRLDPAWHHRLMSAPAGPRKALLFLRAEAGCATIQG